MGVSWRFCCSSWARFIRTPTRTALMGKTVGQSIDGTRLWKGTQLGMLIRSKKTSFILIGPRGWHQNGWKKQNLVLMWKKLMKNVDIEEPTSLLDHVYLACTQRERKPNEKFIELYNKMFESRISSGATEKIPGWERPRKNCSVVLRHGRTCPKKWVQRWTRNHLVLHQHPDMSLENALLVETLSNHQENLLDILIEQVDSVLRLFSIPDLRHEVVLFHLRLGICHVHLFGQNHFFSNESFSMNFRCVPSLSSSSRSTTSMSPFQIPAA